MSTLLKKDGHVKIQCNLCENTLVYMDEEIGGKKVPQIMHWSTSTQVYPVKKDSNHLCPDCFKLGRTLEEAEESRNED